MFCETETTRRTFLMVSTAAAGGLLVSLSPLAAGRAAASAQVGLFVRIEPDNRIIIGAPKPEIGQGVQTSLPMIVAEELDADWNRVAIEALPISLERRGDGYGWKYVSQDVGGSTSVWNTFDDLRRAGAEARRRLIFAAAKSWDVSADDCTTALGTVRHGPSGRQVTYGAVAEAAATVVVPDGDPPLKNRDEFRIIGTSRPSQDVDRLVRGELEFGIDAELPGMLHAVIARAPQLGAKLVSFDDSAARRVPGVRHVVPVSGPAPMGDFRFSPIADGVAVVADSIWAAMKGREGLAVEWSEGAMPGTGSDDLSRSIDAQMQGAGQTLRNDGDVDAAFAAAEHVFEADYDVPLVSHATMEPQGCLAWVRPDGATVIAATQDSSDTVLLTAERTGLDLDQIDGRFTRVGGGFGRRLDEDYVAEAVEVSKAVNAPVRVHWTREDDMRNDFYRPLARHRLRASVRAEGDIDAWSHKIATTGRYFRRGVARDEIYNPEYWLDDFPAQIAANMHVAYYFVETAIPTGPWRAPGHTANAFAVQSFLDEIAHELGDDPLAQRLKILGTPRDLPYGQHGGPVFSTGRLAHVLRKAAEMAGWGEELAPGHGRGIAGHFTFGSYVAHVVDVAVSESGALSILRVNSAVDCGLAVNLNGVRAQTEGGINDGLSTALYQEITLEDGRIRQGNFDSYRMMRMADAPPEINVHIVESPHPPKGMGEPPVPPVAPALCNAIFDATGTRIRRLPVADQLRRG